LFKQRAGKMKIPFQNLFPQKVKQKIASLPRKTKAQSLTEFAIALPVLFILLSGVVEFGFALNYYLSLLDATREAARFFSDKDPFDALGNDDMNFYQELAGYTLFNLDPTSNDKFATEFPDYKGRIIELNPATDEIIITVYARSATGIDSYPTSGPYRAFNVANPPVESLFTAEEIASQFDSNSPNAGILVVEVHYNYKQVLALPWLTRFVPDPFMLTAYTIMPLPAAEPK
jgi:hypothetical protein